MPCGTYNKRKFVFLTKPSNKNKQIFLSRTAFTAERYQQF
jgi:hypothetical protein